MKKQSFKRFLGAAGIGLAAALMAGVPQGKAGSHGTTIQEIKANMPEHKRSRSRIQQEIGGIPLVSYLPNFGLSPKEYGIRYGHGNGKGKTNFARLSHNAKLKRR